MTAVAGRGTWDTAVSVEASPCSGCARSRCGSTEPVTLHEWHPAAAGSLARPRWLGTNLVTLADGPEARREHGARSNVLTSTGAPPGTRTPNPRIKSPLLYSPGGSGEVRDLGRVPARLGPDGTARPAWNTIMARRRRKTLVVCAACHERIHAGQPAAQ